MAPVTPSPHRFVSAQRRKASPVKESRLREEALVNHSDINEAAGQRTPGPNASQFARAPRFSFGRPPQTAQHSRRLQPPTQRLVGAFRIRTADDVEEQEGAEDDDNEMLDVGHDDALPTIEHSDDSRDLPYSPKRRRCSNEQVTEGPRAVAISPTRPIFRQPTTPATNITAARFARPQSVGGSREEGIQMRRPAFLRSNLAPSEQPEPLPEAFSPHRRGEKFVPGGMAATLQQWVVETGQNAAQSRRGQGYLRGEDYVMRFTVTSVSARAPFMVCGKLSDGTEVRLLLVADPKQTHVAVGSDLGVRTPVWDVELEGHSWIVAVDWKVIA